MIGFGKFDKDCYARCEQCGVFNPDKDIYVLEVGKKSPFKMNILCHDCFKQVYTELRKIYDPKINILV